ncbi:MAG TPA: pitrilysin family protein [Blastocatellia bacterium]|nr:pitrilysin family protein [Blastocatellia bacterium]
MVQAKKPARFALDSERIQLPNGLTLLLSENHSTPSVAIYAVVKAGSRFEKDDQAGLAALAAEMIDEGTATRSAEQIANTIDSLGGRLATYGDYESADVALQLLAKDAAIGLEITADLLTTPTFPNDKLDLQINRRAAQIRSRLDVPRTLASDIFNEIVFEGTPQHRPPVGYEPTVKKLVRSDFIEFYRKHYLPSRAILAVAGDIDKAAISSQVVELLEGWSNSGPQEPEPINIPVLQSQPVEKFVNAPKEQVNIFIGHVGIDRGNPDYYALQVMDIILGSSPGFTSRIPRILRDEQGLAYSTFANISSSAGVDPGRFIAYIGTSPENLGRAIGGIRSEIARMVEEPVSIEELETAKAYLTGSFVFRFQKNAQVAEFMVEAELYGLGFDYPERYPEIIRSITVDDVTRATRKYLHPDRLTTVVVGPVETLNS